MQRVKVSEYPTLTGMSYENWALVKIADKTRTNWHGNINQFLTENDLTSETLIQLYHSEGAIKVCNLLLAYFQRLEKEGKPDGKKYSYGKFKVTYLAFMSLFASNEIDLAKDANGKIKALKEYTKTKTTESSLHRGTPQKDQVKAIIDNATTYRVKALASILSEGAGCRIGDACNFQYLQVEPILKSGEPFGYFLIIQEKIGTPAMIALGPNSISLLKMYLAEREGRTGKPIQPNDPLFCSYEERKDEPGRRGSHVGDPMDSSGLTQSINAVIAKCHFPKRYSTHKLRNYFIQSLQKAGLDMSIISAIIGKAHKGSEGEYVLSLPDDEAVLFDFYKQYYHALAIDQPTILKELEDSRFKKQEQTIQKLTVELEDLRNDYEMRRVADYDDEVTELLEIKKTLSSGDKKAVFDALEKIKKMIP